MRTEKRKGGRSGPVEDRTAWLEAQSSTASWRRAHRARALQRLVVSTRRLRWNASLVLMLLEELCIDDTFEELLGSPRDLRPHQHPQAIAVALAIRHSWRPDDLARVAKRLRASAVRVTKPAQPSKRSRVARRSG